MGSAFFSDINQASLCKSLVLEFHAGFQFLDTMQTNNLAAPMQAIDYSSSAYPGLTSYNLIWLLH